MQTDTSQQFFIPQFHLRRIEVCGRAALTGLAFPASHTHTRPASGPEACSRLRVQDVGNDFSVAHRLCRPCRRPIEHTASVMRPGGAKAVDLQGQAVIQIPADRTAHDCHAYQLTVQRTADRKLMSSHAFVVSVVTLNISIGLPQRDRGQGQHVTAHPSSPFSSGRGRGAPPLFQRSGPFSAGDFSVQRAVPPFSPQTYP